MTFARQSVFLPFALAAAVALYAFAFRDLATAGASPDPGPALRLIAAATPAALQAD